MDKAIEICTSNVNEAEYHYKAVCRGLYMQAYELKVFLAKIEDSKVRENAFFRLSIFILIFLNFGYKNKY